MAKQEPAVEAPEEQPAAEAADKRAIVLPNGERRADYIRRRWKEGASRSEITAELNTKELYSGKPGGKIPYQIVFQATKGQPGGPAPKTEEPASEEQPAEEPAE